MTDLQREILDKHGFDIDLFASENEYSANNIGLAMHEYSEVCKQELREENARLRAAVSEMERMLPVLDNLERHNPRTWSDLTQGTGIATLNAYRQALEIAKAKRSQP